MPLLRIRMESLETVTKVADLKIEVAKQYSLNMNMDELQ